MHALSYTSSDIFVESGHKVFHLPFTSGQKGVIFLFCIPNSCIKLGNSSPFYGEPLSVLTEEGIPWHEKMASSFDRTILTEVDEIISTSRNWLYSSMTTSK